MKWLLAFLMVPLSLFGQYELAVCLIFQDDAAYLQEWIEFHKLQGVQHFYLYNNNSTDDYKKVLTPYIKNGTVTLIQWDKEHDQGDGKDWNAIQTGSYMHCIKHFGYRCRWLAVIDSDEFLFCCNGQKLPEFLKKYREFGALAVNWQMFGTSLIYDIPQGSLMIELLTHCAEPNDVHNRTFKSIVQPRYVKRCTNPHLFIFKDEKLTVNPDFQPIDTFKALYVCVDEIRINHYWTRTEKYLREEKIPKRVHMYNDSGAMLLEWAERYNQFEDTTILQFVPKLKAKMGIK